MKTTFITTLIIFLITTTAFAASKSWNCNGTIERFDNIDNTFVKVADYSLSGPIGYGNAVTTNVNFDGIEGKIVFIYNAKGTSTYNSDPRTQEGVSSYLEIGSQTFHSGRFAALDGKKLPSRFSMIGELTVDNVFYLNRIVCIRD